MAYWCGIADATWTAIGLAVGTYLNWLITSRRLRRYSEKAGNAITLPEFFSNRFHEKGKLVMTISAFFILVFFTVYAASCLVTCGKLFSTLFGLDYVPMMIVGAVFVLVYTIIGGFSGGKRFGLYAVHRHDRGAGNRHRRCRALWPRAAWAPCWTTPAPSRDFLDFFGVATPVTADGVQQAVGGVPQFGAAGSYGFLSILSTLAWGLGYFGMPQVLLRFMAIRNEHELTRSRRIATVWVIISLAVAVFIGVIGRVLYPDALTTSADAENVFILLSTRLLPPLLAGLVMAGILAATISSSDSYLLIAASAFSKNIYQGLLHRKATDKQVLLISRITLLAITVIAIFIAMDENSVIFTIVSFAWAGFGATFGPLMLMSLFWKRINRAGAVAGMIGGGGMVFVWKLLIRPLGGVWDIYELLPAFLFSVLCILVFSLLTAPPSEEICKEFEEVRLGK